MKLLKSKKLTIPSIFFITDREEIKEIPVGIPFIFGDKKDEEYIIRILEYETLYQAAVKTGYPFNFKKLLKENGFTDLQSFYFDHPIFIDIKKDEDGEGEILDPKEKLDGSSPTLKEFIKDSAAYVNIEKLKDLHVFPVWMDTIEDAISTNIHNFAVYNSNLYNKKLEGMYGGLDMTSPPKNLIIIDISGSIPKAVSSTCLALAKNLSASFYADLLITGSKSTLYQYEEIYKLNIETIYKENKMDNDQVYFKKLVTTEERVYKTAIVFGDNHNPGWKWQNEFNNNTKDITIETGKKLCKWKIDKLISFHTENGSAIAGYGLWFSPKETESIKNWVKYLEN